MSSPLRLRGNQDGRTHVCMHDVGSGSAIAMMDKRSAKGRSKGGS